MKKFVAMLAAMFIAMVSLTGLASTAQADSSYPQPSTPQIKLTLSLDVVVGGGDFVAVATTTTPCDSLALDWNGQHAENPGSKVVHTFTAPDVEVKTVIMMLATCHYTASGTTGNAISPAAQILTATAPVTVLPRNSDGSGLPNTGGPSVGWLVAGILALVAGAGAMVFGKRRSGAAS